MRGIIISIPYAFRRVRSRLARAVRAIARFYGDFAEGLVKWVVGRTWYKTVRRPGQWVAIGLLAASALILQDAGGLLAAIESQGERVFGATAFTGFKLRPWETGDLESALTLWRDTLPNIAPGALGWHVRVDLFVFIPTYCVALGLLLRRTGASLRFAAGMAGVLLLADVAETAATWWFLTDLRATGAQLVIIQSLSSLKWVLVALIAVAILVYWANREDPTSASAQGLWDSLGKARRGEGTTPGVALKGLLVLVGLFTIVVAAPAGGPLEQVPDVIRYQVEQGFQGPLIWAMGALILFAIAVGVAGWLATYQPESRRPTMEVWDWVVPLLGMAISVALLLIVRLTDQEWRVGTLASGVVVIAIAIAAWVAQVSRATPTSAASGTETGAIVEKAWQEADRQSARAWSGGLAGAVVVIGGLGLVRAAGPVVILGLDSSPQGIDMRWRGALVGGIFAATVLGWFTQWLSVQFSPTTGRGVAVYVAAVGVTLAALVWPMARHPETAERSGTTGVLAIGLGFLALLIGTLTWLSRSGLRWPLTGRLGYGRTPWLSMVVLVWLVAGALDATGGYHSARVEADLGRGEQQYSAGIHNAYKQWVEANVTTKVCGHDARDRIPLVLVAAPGGGIRAAYWTASALEQLIATDCDRLAVFAISGVSGGSLGATTWLATQSAGDRDNQDPAITSANSAVSLMSEDRALSAATAGLVFRDLFQPFTGISTKWRDRAALLEDGWAASAPGALGDDAVGYRWSSLGEGLQWTPVLVLNGSSVTDGCRVLVANVANLAVGDSVDCFSPSSILEGTKGHVTGAIDANDLHERLPNQRCPATPSGMRSTTAALLSARFPLISPSGAISRCVNDTPTVTYVVDGGYYENSLLTLLQVWDAVEQLVRQHNQTSLTNGEPLIEPWIVVLDNHYRSQATVPPPGRPREIYVPAAAKLNAGATVGQPALEQMAITEMSSVAGPCRIVETLNSEDTSGSRRVECEEYSREPPAMVRLAPSISPGVDAPLGWVLSKLSRENLDRALTRALAPAGAPRAALSSKLSALAEYQHGDQR